MCNLQGEYGGRNIHAVFNGIDAFTRDPSEFTELRLRQSRLPSHHLKIVEKFWMVFSHFEDIAVLTCDGSQADI